MMGYFLVLRDYFSVMLKKMVEMLFIGRNHLLTFVNKKLIC